MGSAPSPGPEPGPALPPADRPVLLLAPSKPCLMCHLRLCLPPDTRAGPARAPLGTIFSSLTAARLLGSSLHGIATWKRDHLAPMHLLSLAVLIAVFSLFVLTFSTRPGQESPVGALRAFLLIELACGLFCPSRSFLRREVIPETERAGSGRPCTYRPGWGSSSFRTASAKQALGAGTCSASAPRSR